MEHNKLTNKKSKTTTITKLYISNENAKLNEEKYEEIRIDFTRKMPFVDSFTSISINIDIVDHAKILNMIISNDLKWNH